MRTVVALLAFGVAQATLVPGGSFKDGFHYDPAVSGWVGNYFSGYNIYGNPAFVHDPVESMDGDSQKIWSDGVPFNSGIYTTVTGVTPGQGYKVEAWMTSNVEQVGLRVGVDPTGGTDPQAASVVWGPMTYGPTFHHNWSAAVAEGNSITIFCEVSTFGGAYPACQTWTDIVEYSPQNSLSLVSRSVSGVTASGATITWVTTLPSTSQVFYGTTIDCTESTPVDPAMVLEHEMTLADLLPDQQYYYKVASTAPGFPDLVSTTGVFTTGPLAITAGPAAQAADAYTALVTWTTNSRASSQVEYGLTTAYGSWTPLDPTPEYEHAVVIEGLEPDTTYHYRVHSVAPNGRSVISGDGTFYTEALAITAGPAAEEVKAGSARIVWTTNLASDSLVEYGPSPAYGESVYSGAAVTDHEVLVEGLEPCTTYHYRVTSTREGHPAVQSADGVFTTADGARSPEGWFRPGWNLFSVPVEPAEPDPERALADLVAAGNVIENNLYRYTRFGYRLYPSEFMYLSAGEGYWLKLTVGAQALVTGTVIAGEVELPLYVGWQIIGSPRTVPVPLADCRILRGGEYKTLPEAGAAGWVQPVLYFYDGGYRAAQVGGDWEELEPWKAYWLKAFASGCSFVVPGE